MTNRIILAKEKIRSIIAQSVIPEDSRHADNVLEWLLRINPNADIALQLAALAHDIDRANEATRVQRADFDNYDSFKAAHANNSATILQKVLQEYRVKSSLINEACRLVALHEIGGDPRSNLLKDVDSISYFEVNMPLYLDREGCEETLRRCIWGYNRLSIEMQMLCNKITYSNDQLNNILQLTIYSFM